MTSTPYTVPARLTGVLLVTSMTLMVAGAVIVVPSGLTLNPSDPAGALAAIHARVGLHLFALALDVLGWVALLTAALTIAAAKGRPGLVPAGLLAGAALAGLLHDAGNLAVTQLEGDVRAVLLTAKWTVNLAGLLWAAATIAAARWLPLPAGLRRAGTLAAVCGLAAVVLPWTTGTAGPSVGLEQVGYALQLPVMVWYVVLGCRELCTPA